MHIRNLSVMGGALVAFAVSTWAAGCGGQSVELESEDAGIADAQIADAQIADVFIDSRAVDATADAASTCPPHYVMCNGECTDTRFDPSACGSCTSSCGPGEVCANGVCASTCPSTEAACKDEDGGLRCADALTDNANCGYCGNVCGAGTVCSNGKCSLTCGADETKCAAGDGTAYCADLQTDPDDCNSCGNACPLGSNAATRFCSAGQCGVTCNSDFLDCNHDPADGCEVYPSSNPSNCGACGNICPVGASCSNGGCTCGSVYGEIVEACNGMCTNVETDPTNCGVCGTRCTSTDAYVSADCVEGACHTSNRAASALGTASSIAIDDTYLYYTDSLLGIRRVTKGSTGETPVTVIADPQAGSIAINGGTIFWTNDTGVFKCPVSGCVGSPKAVSDVPSAGSRIVVDATNLYWTIGSNGIDECPQTGCDDAPLRLTTQNTFAMTPGPSSLFVVAEPSFSSLNIQSITLTDPPTSSVVVSYANSAAGLAYHGGQLYWDSGTSIVGCDPTACTPKVIAAVPPPNYSRGPIIADDIAVFWASDGIHETILATAADSVIANIKSNATQLALDSKNVYWAASDGVYWIAR